MMDHEQRNNRRLIPSDGRDSAVIQHKGREDVALIVNLSAQGFRICTHPGFPVEVGDVLQLETTDGYHRARVANLEEKDDRLFIGLERLHDAPVKQPRKALRGSFRRNRMARPRVDAGALVTYLMIPFALVMALLFVAVGWDGIREMVESIRRQLP